MMLKRVLGLLVVALFVATAPAPAGEPALEDDTAKTLYALGLAMSQRLVALGFDETEVDTIQAGLSDGLLKKTPRVDIAEFGPKIDGVLSARLQGETLKEKSIGRAYFEEAAKTEGAVKTDSGALYIENEAGTGASPTASDTVQVHYHGTLIDGTIFDSSLGVGEPATFNVGVVVPCFAEGLQKMKVGGKARLVCPAESAYGDRGFPPAIKPGATIIFDVNLMGIEEPEGDAAAADAPTAEAPASDTP